MAEEVRSEDDAPKASPSTASAVLPDPPSADTDEDSLLRQIEGDQGFKPSEYGEPKGLKKASKERAPEKDSGTDPPEEAEDDPPPSAKKDDEGDDKTDKTDKTSPEEDPDYEKAIEALKKDGMPKSVRDRMSREEILEMGLKRAKSQADVHSKLSDRGRQAKTDESLAEPADTAEPARQPSDANLDEVIKPFREEIAAQLGDEAGDAAGAALKQMGEALLGPLQGQLLQTQQALQQQINATDTILLMNTRRSLREAYPEVDTPETWANVEQKARQLIKGGGYSEGQDVLANLEEAFSDAAGILLGKAKAEREAKQKRERNKKKNQGQATSPPSLKERDVPMTYDEYEVAIYNAIQSGDSAEIDRINGAWQEAQV